jgi:osmotically-inducible protein OsmY
MTTATTHVEPEIAEEVEIRSGDAIIEDIWAQLWQDDGIRNLDLNDLLIRVENGAVRLWGHVGKGFHRIRIAEIASSVPGVQKVENDLIMDFELQVEVAQALYRDQRTRPLFLNVDCMHGWISVLGQVPNQSVCEVVEEVISKISQVRGILHPPMIMGQAYPLYRRVVQPDIGARVYAEVGLTGRVTKVVINPRNRLVTHFAVKAGGEAAGLGLTAEFVLPIETIDVVNDENVILSDRVQRIETYSQLDEQAYPPAPQDWQSPFPYQRGEVHWEA